MSRKTTSAVLAAMAAVLLFGAAPGARAAHLDVVEVRIHASDVRSGAHLGWVNPGDTLILPPRTEVKLWLEALPRGRGPRYPGAYYDVTDGATVRGHRRRVVVRRNGHGREVAGIKSTNPRQGAVVLQTFGREGESVVRYSIAAPLRGLSIPRELRSSAFIVRVRDGAGYVPIGRGPYGYETDAVRVLVAELYRGILLREPDARGLADYAELIYERGYPGAIDAAVDIARSEESRYAVDRRAGDERRLAALYRHLLGLDPDEVGRDRWYDDLESLRDGDLAHVVDWIVRSDEFSRRFGFEDRRYARQLPY